MELTEKQVQTISRYIRAAVHTTCMRYGLLKAQHEEDMEQEAWVEVLRIKDRYDPNRGAALMTFLYLPIHHKCARYAQQQRRRDGMRLEASALDRIEASDGSSAALELEELDRTLVLKAMGYTDSEIASATGMSEREVTKWRRARQRELLDGQV